MCQKFFRLFCFLLSASFLFAGCTGGSSPDVSENPAASSPVNSEQDPTEFEENDDSSTAAESSEQSLDSSSDNGFHEETEAILKEMTLEEKVGQLFFIRCPEAEQEKIIAELHPGGLILFGRDFKGETSDSVRSAIKRYQNASKLPLLIGVDEEGGTVVRASRYTAFRSSPFASPRELFKAGGYALVKKDATEKAAFLADLSINVNLAPVCDLSGDPADFIYQRSFSGSAADTAEFVKTVVSVSESADVATVLKHFPGYGSNADTHTGFSVDDRALSSLQEKDLLPFQAGIEAGSGAILCSHNLVTCLDKTYPVSLSPAWHEFLRHELAFDGVIMTDDLEMAAIVDAYGVENAAVLAILAGNDLLISSDYERQIPAVLAAVADGRIDISIIDRAVLRVLQWKFSTGLL